MSTGDVAETAKAAFFNAKSISRVGVAAAMGILLSTHVFEPAVGRSIGGPYKLVMGSPEQCAPFLELFSHSRFASFEVRWRATGRPATSRHEGAVTFESPSSGITIRFERRPMSKGLGEILTFSHSPQVDAPPAVGKSFRAMSECKLVERLPIEACVLDDDMLAKKFNLPALTSTRVYTQDGISQLFGNGYGVFRFRAQDWIAIRPLGRDPPNTVFGFALADPDVVVAEAASSLFQFGCQLDQKR